ncbi:hypothetical protein CEXT_622841 [Caerostris extrusa]|uniref:Uncharacterized protein n=1 Tax=Caerostris extrusa TaxID=172846 RepID=A0AAV4UQV3_CAEEX|nr:hypothetical protein CEXT_622841 [Caerostris extrusa]
MTERYLDDEEKAKCRNENETEKNFFELSNVESGQCEVGNNCSLQQRKLTLRFSVNVFLTDEILKGGVFHLLNSYARDASNPHARRPRAFLERLAVKVWSGIVYDFLIIIWTRLQGVHIFRGRDITRIT